jgi:proteasome lid subunit RPN8/RPN11
MTTAVYLTQTAQHDLRHFRWSDVNELGGTLLGSSAEDRIVRIDRILANPRGPEEPDSTSIDHEAYWDMQRYATPGDPHESIIIGDIHSHPTSGLVRLSFEDLSLLTNHSIKLGTWVSMVVAPSEKWIAGNLVADWNEDPNIGVWVGLRGEVAAGFLLHEPFDPRRPIHA